MNNDKHVIIVFIPLSNGGFRLQMKLSKGRISCLKQYQYDLSITSSFYLIIISSFSFVSPIRCVNAANTQPMPRCRTITSQLMVLCSSQLEPLNTL